MSPKVVFFVFMIALTIASAFAAFYGSRWLGVPGNWPWLPALIAVPISGRFFYPIVLSSVRDGFRGRNRS